MKLGERKALHELWIRYYTERAIEDRDRLILQYLDLVKLVVGRLAANLPPHVKLDDLYSSGVTGLIKAVERFDPLKGSKFESYARFLIRGAMIDEMRRLDWIPRSIHQKAQAITRAQEQIAQRKGREATDQEVAAHLGLTEEAYGRLLERIRPAILLPLNAESNEDAPLAERIPDLRPQTSDELLDKKAFLHILEKELESVPEQERRVLTLYYFEDLMLKEIGKILGVSESRVSQIHSKALLRLRSRLRSVADEFTAIF